MAPSQVVPRPGPGLRRPWGKPDLDGTRGRPIRGGLQRVPSAALGGPRGCWDAGGVGGYHWGAIPPPIYLVGGLEHFLFFHTLLGIMIPID